MTMTLGHEMKSPSRRHRPSAARCRHERGPLEDARPAAPGDREGEEHEEVA